MHSAMRKITKVKALEPKNAKAPMPKRNMGMNGVARMKKAFLLLVTQKR